MFFYSVSECVRGSYVGNSALCNGKSSCRALFTDLTAPHLLQFPNIEQICLQMIHVHAHEVVKMRINVWS